MGMATARAKLFNRDCVQKTKEQISNVDLYANNVHVNNVDFFQTNINMTV